MSMHGVKIKKERRVPLQGLMGGRGAVKGLKGGGGGEGTKGGAVKGLRGGGAVKGLRGGGR